MEIRVVETFLKGRDKDVSLCEDGFIVTEHYAVMIDGAGTPSPMLFNGKKGGRHIMEMIMESIPYLRKDLNQETFLTELNNIIINNYKANGWYDELQRDVNLRPMASIVVFSKVHRQLWFYGDCKALIDGVVYENPKFIDEVMLNARKMVVEGELIKGISPKDLAENDMGREYIETLLSYQRLFLHNRNFDLLSFSMIDGFDFLSKDIKVVDVSNEVHEIVLSTDGYAVLKPTVKETEEVLMKQLKTDPLAINELKGFKTYNENFHSIDDRAYLRFKLF